MNNLTLVFSGGCFSGKTSTIDKFKELLGDHCITLDEIVRKKDISSIEDMRKDSRAYLRFQQEIISEKILQEVETENKNIGKVILIDRALSDSLFYLNFYVDKSQLQDEDFNFYSNLLTKVTNSAKYAFDNVYDFILQFSPINKRCDDKVFRPLNINNLKHIEGKLISIYTKSFTKNKIVKVDLNNNDDVFVKFITERNMNFPNSYDEYNLAIRKLYLFDNIYTNKIGSVNVGELNEDTFYKYFYTSSCLFSHNQNLSNSIIEQVRNISAESAVFATKCYPTGYFKQGNIMIVGEAPGQSGKGLDEGLKPSFVFEKTSFILRRAIFENRSKFKYFPYITNLCKYANENNKIGESDFDKCWDIFMNEVHYMNPEKIIVLGNNAYNYITENISDEFKSRIVKFMHPSATLYKGISIKEYSEQLKKVL